MNDNNVLVSNRFDQHDEAEYRLMRMLNQAMVELCRVYQQLDQRDNRLVDTAVAIGDDQEHNIAYSLAPKMQCCSGHVWIDVSLDVSYSDGANKTYLCWLTPKQTTWIACYLLEQFDDQTLLTAMARLALGVAANLESSASEIRQLISDGKLLQQGDVIQNRVLDMGSIAMEQDHSKTLRLHHLVREEIQ
ncbi:MAG: hypothetical protein AUJ28_04195 [Parcubacteria group bacterium CG1_02_37_51]|uniref:Uncharacterized protein n=2 Tax=Candidatus Komeiliibacteriota TaxID=1817908 RepID=A0A2M8DRQ9_9BACT|nr:MAG: hypothetical protein AUJ28_04195 [Parcubacteria group bacterium CG1_02_37_51]PIY94386.1 MAG: hypothetical protein COY67_02565 [Candidatus Komeilibacteria bacterium CG_4_10_14_0_8_um_filter_37_78]PJC02057.1 MAG: hypothetical protein CO073_01470 [Candidatus Komeilibacteria bacterium CG_4_9_14_0_8_um_filter_36_9]